MTNWQDNIQQAVADLGSGQGTDFGYAYVERQNTKTYMVQSYGPLEEMHLDFDAAVQRLIEVAKQNTSRSSQIF